jgi:phosphoglycolate phosphatase-like HAD superfamily hydrolase
MTQAIFFDFDGVIMDSMGLKLDSYCYALEQFNFTREAIKDLVHVHAGLSRHKILDLMYEQLSGHKPSKMIASELVERFTDHDDRSRVLMQPIPGTLPFLDHVHTLCYTAVVTGTPQDVVNKTITYHALAPYFDEVRGSPQSKVEIVEEIISDQDLSRDQCLFIGDGKTDQEAADTCHIRFVGLNYGTVSFTHSRAWKVVPSLMDLLPHLDKLA